MRPVVLPSWQPAGPRRYKTPSRCMTRYAPTLPSQVGRYQVIRSLGRGAMGQVLLAHDPVLGRTVAVKHLRDDLSLSRERFSALSRRMEQEAKAAARVNHPNLVALHEMGRDPIVGLFLVFEYVEGETLDERLKRGPLLPGEAARLARELGGALSEAHASDVLHRDIKPENVLLGKTGAKIADFGVAWLPNSSLPRPGALLGTPAYSAPEAIDRGRFSPESDQFSMACTLFEAISARRAFPGDDAAMVAELVQTSEPAALARAFRLNARVDVELARAFSKNPASRFPSCDEFGRALGGALEASVRRLPTRLEDDAEEPVASRPRRLGSLAGAVLSTLALVAALGFVYEKGWRVSFAQAGSPTGGGAVAPAERGLTPMVWLYERPLPRPSVQRSHVPEHLGRARAADAGAGEP